MTADFTQNGFPGQTLGCSWGLLMVWTVPRSSGGPVLDTYSWAKTRWLCARLRYFDDQRAVRGLGIRLFHGS